MPVYEYLCEKCGHEFEREQRITEEPVKTCPSCRAKKVRRLISRTAFVLKGGGWYSDLYSSGKPAASGEAGGSAKEATASEPPSGAAPESKADAKPAAGASPAKTEAAPSSKSPKGKGKPKAAA